MNKRFYSLQVATHRMNETSFPDVIFIPVAVIPFQAQFALNVGFGVLIFIVLHL